MNLLSNAIKFTTSGGKINITTKLLRSDLDLNENDFGEKIKTTKVPYFR